MASANDLDAWEEQATQTLNCIRCLIDGLRSATYPVEIPGLLQKPKEVANSQAAEFSLVDHLRSAGVFDLVQQLGRQECDASDDQGFDLEASASSDNSKLHLETDERHQILHHVIFPLLTRLQNCYTILDNAPQTAAAPQSAPERNKNKPHPTKGMLSLNDYTNVACLLEFVVCTSLLPQMGHYSFLDEAKAIDRSNAMLLAQKRSRSLPKSLAGRVSSQSLGWGMYAADKYWSRSRSSEHTGSARNRAIMLHQNCNELSQLTITVGKLVLLDRFRPMLLPRHLADLYMALLFHERCKWNLVKLMKSDVESSLVRTLIDTVSDKEMIQHLQKALLFTPLQMKPAEATTHQFTSGTELNTVDHREAALACRNLLGGDAAVMMIAQVSDANPKQETVQKIPPWIRMRLGQCLTKLAECDLHAVVDVFVASARGMGSESSQQDEDIMTGAAARLARALCARPSSDNASTVSSIFQTRLCNQFIDFLVEEGEVVYRKLLAGTEDLKNDVLERKLSRSCAAMLYTLWATISQLSDEILQTSFVCRLSSGLVPSNQGNISIGKLTTLQSTAAIWIWLSGAPSFLDPSTVKKMHSIILTNMCPTTYTRSDCTILGQILRLAGSFRQASSGSTLVMEVDSDFHANNASQLLTEMVVNQMICCLLQEEKHVYPIALEMVKAVAADEFDREGFAFGPLINNRDASLPNKEYIRGAGESELADILQGVERRGGVMLDVIIAPIATAIEKLLANERNFDSLDRIEYSLPSALFRLVLMIHFYTSSSTNNDNNIAARVNAKLSQYCLVDLLKKDFHASRIAATVMLGSLCEKCSPTSILLGKSQGQQAVNADILELLAIIIDCAASQMEIENSSSKITASPQELFSTASIVVSLLVSLLELGSDKRSDHDESLLQSMLTSLQTLSISTQNQSRREKENDQECPPLSVELAELAEMSSHAMALIVARRSDVDEGQINEYGNLTSKSGLDLFAEKLSIAERDLESSQPPLRAKAVVSLRHIARSFNADNSVSGFGIEKAKVMVTEVESPLSTDETASYQTQLVARSLARICFVSLSDAESYVYLASIQTLVAICDICPNEMLTLTATLVAKGTSDFTILSPEARLLDTTLLLSSEQRIKSAEALMFMIRRRGKAIYSYSRFLLDLMIFGSTSSNPTSRDRQNLSNENSLDIQVQTHSYFIGSDGKEGHDNADFEERKVRVNTGGPVFKLEEDDLLRATSISVVVELVALLKPATIAPYCHTLVQLVIDVLQLDGSRPVRRAAASLARELYVSVENELSCNDNLPPTASMAVAMVCSRENILHNILQACAAGSNDSIGGRIRYTDAATQSRCFEAVEIRHSLKSMSVFDAASLVAQSMEVENEPVVKAVRKILT